MTTATEPACLQLSLADYPGMNPFVLDWLNGDERFLPHVGQAPSPVPGQASPVGQAWAPVGQARAPVGQAWAPDLHNALIESNKRWGIFVRDEVERWARGEAPALIAGQQVGFAGGPLYTLAKIATLLKLKKQHHPNATIFFWLATEDHDFDEAATLSLPIPNNQLDLMHIAVSHAVDSKAMVGPQVVPEPLIADLLAQLNIPRPTWLREGITFRDSFAELIAHVFQGEKIVLVDALLPELRRAGATLFQQIANRADEVQSALATRSSALAKAGYLPQVVPREGEDYTLFFRIDEHGNRDVMHAPFEIGDPTTISTSALTRPLLQDFIFRPAIFVGGPSEVAYYAQIAPLHDLLGVPLPRVALRGHALVAPKRVTRAFQRYHIEPREIFRNVDEILAEREPESVARVRKLSDEGKRELLARIAEIADIALPAEHALARAVNRSIGHIEYHFTKLSERAIKGLARKDRERLLAVRELVATLFPDRHVQDRIVGWIPFFCQYDGQLIERMIDEIEPDAPVCRIIAL